MRYFAIIALFVGLGLAGAAAVMARDMIERIQAENTVVQEVPTERVVVFARSLPRGHLIAREDLTEVQYVAGQMTVEVVGARAIGQWLTQPVASGQPVVASILSTTSVPLQGQFIRVRRGSEVTRVCVAFCPEDAL